jgi:hypothetical protein
MHDPNGEASTDLEDVNDLCTSSFRTVESILLATIGLSPPPSLTATGRMFDELAARAHDPRPAGPVRARPAPAFHALGFALLLVGAFFVESRSRATRGDDEGSSHR